MNDFNGSNYPAYPGSQYKPPSKLGQFILDPRTSVKNYISDALTEPSRPPSAYPGPYTPYNPALPPQSRPPLDAPFPLRPGNGRLDPNSPPGPPVEQDLSSLFPPPGTSGNSGPNSRTGSRPSTPPQELSSKAKGNSVSAPRQREGSVVSLQTPDSMNDPVARPASRISGYPDPMQYGGPSPIPSPQPQHAGFGQLGGPPPQQMNFHGGLAPPGDMALSRSMGDMSLSQMQQMNGMAQMNQMGNMGQMNMGIRPQPQVMTVATMNQGAPATKALHRMVNDYNTLKAGYYMAHIRKFGLTVSSRTILTILETDSGDLTQVIARLRLLAREIWSLRHRRASEFDGSEAHAEAVISYWKDEFEFWSDIFEDAYDPVQQQISSMIKQQSQYAVLCGLEESASNGERDASEKPKKKKKPVVEVKRKSVMFKPGDEEQVC